MFDCPDFQNDVQFYFNKKFSFKKSEFKLPSDKGLYLSHQKTSVPALQKIKNELNRVKSKLNDFEITSWSSFTRQRNPSSAIIYKIRNEINAEFVTQAFCKFFECCVTYNLVRPQDQKFNSLHLCEAPGAFITALNHFIMMNYKDIEWHWRASTLNPYFEGNSTSQTILDDRFIFHTLSNWIFGKNYTGDITNLENIQSLKDECSLLGNIQLISSDGSIDCINTPEIQEEYVGKLHLVEMIVSLLILADGGSMVLKMFTFFEHNSICMLFIMNCCFEKVHVFKPATSKEGNSEVYVIGLNYDKSVLSQEIFDVLLQNFNDDSKALLPLEQIPANFVTEVINCARYFSKLQTDVIENNIWYFQKYDKREVERVKMLKCWIADEYVSLYGMQPIPEELKILHGLKVNNDYNLNVRIHSGSYTERQLANNLEKDGKLTVLYDKLKVFYDDVTEKPFNQKILKLEQFYGEIINSGVEFLSFISGNSILRVKSSKFILVPIFKYFNELLDFVQEHSPYVEVVDLSRNENLFIVNQNRIAIVKNSYQNAKDYNLLEKKLIEEIINFILNSEMESIFIENLLILTQFSVGFILFLGMFVFKELSFQKNGTIQLKLVVEDGKEKLRCFLNKLKETEVNLKGKAVIGICDTTYLFQSRFYKSVVNYNNQLTLQYCSFYLSVF